MPRVSLPWGCQTIDYRLFLLLAARNAMKKIYLTPIFLILALVAQGILAQTRSPVLESELVFEYPGLHDREALVEVEFTVNEEGKAESFQVVGGFYEQRFVDATVNALQEVTFRPAMENNEPVDWSGFRVSARFVIEDLFNTIQPGFSNRMKEIENLIASGDHAAAETLALETLDNSIQYHFEFAYLNLRLSQIYLLENKLFDAAAASHWATLSYMPGEHRNYGHQSAKLTDSFNIISVNQFIDADIYSTVDVNTSLVINNALTAPLKSQRPPHLRSGLRFSSQGSDLGDKSTMDVLNVGLMQDALQTGIQIHARLGHLTAMKNALERYGYVNPRAPAFLEEIEAIADSSLSSGAPIQSLHQVRSNQAVFYPVRNTFTVANVTGTLSSIDIQCENRTTRLQFQAGLEWQIPGSWGVCSLRFHGEEGTEFSVIEFS